jgi:Zn-dependent protease
MKWSWRIARVFGIDLYVHATFLLLVAWEAMRALMRDGTVRAAAGGVALVTVVFAIVVLHELGHALTARRFGIHTRDITLLPIGGVSHLERMPEKPKQELLVAVAGPSVNLVLALVLFVANLVVGEPLLVTEAPVLQNASFLATLFWVNVGLATFNLLPAFPMDGGRVLRALLALRFDRIQATRLAAQIGQGMAFMLGFAGLFLNPMLVLIGAFIWLGAAAEANAVEAKEALRALPVHHAMTQNVRVLAATEPLEAAARALMVGAQDDFPVVDTTGRLAGVLTRDRLVAGLSRHGPRAPVGRAMDPSFAVAGPYEMLDAALRRLEGRECQVLPIVQEDGQIVGLVTPEKVEKLLKLRSAIQQGRRQDADASSVG